MLYRRNKQWTDLTAMAVDSKGIITLVHEKCIKQPVPNVSKNAKYHSSLLKENQFSAENVTRKEKVTNYQKPLKVFDQRTQ